MQSLWTDTVTLPTFPTLEKDEAAEVCIIGGGMAGILCAYFLKDAGIDCLLCEADTIGSGTTSGTTAVISAQHDTLYGTLIKQFGYTMARLYLEANLHAVSSYEMLAQGIDCDFEKIPASIYSCDNPALMEAEAGTLHSLGYKAHLLTKIPHPVPALAAVEFPDQAQFHPLKFIAAVAKDLPIKEHTRVTGIEKNTVYAGDYKITAGKIIVTTHFPFLNTRGLYFAKLHQRRSYVLTVKDPAATPGSYVDHGTGGLYFRTYKDMLLIGGGDHRTGKEGGRFAPLYDFAKEHYSTVSECYSWATQDCISLDGVPYIGHYSKNTPHLFVATGFNEWGMTPSMVSALLLRDLVQGRENKYAEVFSPSRSMLRMQLFSNLGVSIAGLLTPSRMRCPHLGCALKWNPYEHTWDCACHGSRFTKDGKLLCNPATGDLPHVKDMGNANDRDGQ